MCLNQFSFIDRAPNHNKCHLKILRSYSPHHTKKGHQQIALKHLFNSICCPDRAQGDSAKKKLPFNWKKPQNQTQEGLPSASTGWGLRGQEKGGQQATQHQIEFKKKFRCLELELIL